MSIIIDPRVELMSIVQLLSGNELITSYDFRYKREVQASFAAYQKHAAVQLFGKMHSEGFNLEIVPRATFYLTNPPQLEQQSTFDNDIYERAGGEARLLYFVNCLRDFAQQSRFMEFFESQQETFEQVLQGVRPTATYDIQQLRDYFGMPLRDATLILGLLLHRGGFGTSHQIQGRLYVHALIGPMGSVDDMPIFGPEQFITEMIVHEFCHTVINPLTDAHAEQIAQLEYLYTPIATDMQAQIGKTWADCVTEHIMRAVTSRSVALRYGESAARALAYKHQAWNFIYVPRLLTALRHYEQQRDKYPTLECFYPELLAAFEDV